MDNNIFNNMFDRLYYTNEQSIETLRKLTNIELVKGNLVVNPYQKICTIFVDKSPFLYIKKTNFEQKLKFLECICKRCDITPYLTYVYKNGGIKSNSIDDNIMILYYELDYIINGIFFNVPNVLIVYFGNNDYASMLTAPYKNDKNVHNIFVSNIYNYHLENVDKYIDNFVDKIQKGLELCR